MRKVSVMKLYVQLGVLQTTTVHREFQCWCVVSSGSLSVVLKVSSASRHPVSVKLSLIPPPFVKYAALVVSALNTNALWRFTTSYTLFMVNT